jgi:hypothetical protein
LHKIRKTSCSPWGPEAGSFQLTHLKQVVEIKESRSLRAAAAVVAAAALCDCHYMLLEFGFDWVDGEALHSLICGKQG